MSFFTALLLVKSHGGRQQLLRVPGTAPGERLESPAVRAIVSDKELLQLSHRSFG
jgi:hypothetical protein